MIWNMYVKEMKDVFRDRRTLLMIVFLPLILLSGLVFFYESLMNDDKSETYTVAIPSELSEEGKAFFSDMPTIELDVFDDPKGIVDEGEASVALLTEPDFFESLGEKEMAEVTLYGDSMSQDASYVMNMIESTFSIAEQEIVNERLAANNVDETILEAFQVKRVEPSYNDANGSSLALISMLLPMAFSIAIVSGASSAAMDLFAGEKERKTMESLLMTPVDRSKILISKWLTISTIGALTGILAVILIVIETIFFTEKMKAAFSINEGMALVIVTTLAMTVLFALFIAALLMVISIIAKSIKESQSYIAPVSMLSIVPMFFITSMGVKEFTVVDFILPFMNLYAILKQLLYGITDITNIALTLGSTAVYVLILFAIARVLFMKDRWVL
ncbi:MULTISPECIES: ABC transporter permease [Pontibacillus]|uniref:ABC transporter permease subunit n=1 Tax=Pontibacillus chungwhensis TaxID=265426 RepID=A0ABY8V039_9BACI|nr:MULTISPECIES: ABC transporter permease subunit [Pontibacillus]MCD5325758.1 ABC transporter permease subunit [Pontibacillus sp. HN14]WIF98005.1 ABC transporter permease subunit [Pontibacillus chungwhensis]